MTPEEIAATPAWPDFSLKRVDSKDMEIWRASTNTGRPGTPVFSLLVARPGKAPLDSSAARIILGHELQRRFEQAHPNGCPGGH